MNIKHRKSTFHILAVLFLSISIFFCVGQAGLSVACQGCPAHHPAKRTDLPDYKTVITDKAAFHVVTLPPEGSWEVSVGAVDQLDSPEGFAKRYHANIVLNGGFFDPVNRKTTSMILLSSGKQYLPGENERLIENPKLALYLDKILNHRPELRKYRCGPDSKTRYVIVAHPEPDVQNCRLLEVLGAGPTLLVHQQLPTPEEWKSILMNEGFIDYQGEKLSRDPIGVYRPNARSAVGIAPDGTVILVMAAQEKPTSDRLGVSLSEMAAFLYHLGAREAMALDGGSSSAMYANSETFYGKLDNQGQPVKRQVKSVLLIRPK